jgi:hypothetical protein
LGFYLADHDETHNNHQGIKNWVDHAKMNQVLRLIGVKVIDVLVQAAEVKQDHYERVKGTNGMIWLSLFDVT